MSSIPTFLFTYVYKGDCRGIEVQRVVNYTNVRVCSSPSCDNEVFLFSRSGDKFKARR